MGTAIECSEYCKKEESRKTGTTYTELGSISADRKGFRSDLADAAILLQEAGLKRVAEEMPAVYIRNYRGLMAYQEITKPAPSDSAFEPRPWQAKILKKLEGPSDDRTIHWVHDSTGNTGKSRLVRHICAQMEGVVLTGKLADIAHLWSKGRYKIACFDISRTQQEHMEHLIAFAEMLKNGFICSGKYDGSVQFFDSPHVIFFSNSRPKDGYWSSDRLQLTDLDNPAELRAYVEGEPVLPEAKDMADLGFA